MFIGHKCYWIMSFECWLIKTWKCSAGVRWLHLCRCKIFGASIPIFVWWPIESCHFFVKIASESLSKLYFRSCRYRFIKRNSSDLGAFIVINLWRSCNIAATGRDSCRMYVYFKSVKGYWGGFFPNFKTMKELLAKSPLYICTLGKLWDSDCPWSCILNDDRPFVTKPFKVWFQGQIIVHWFHVGWKDLPPFSHIHTSVYDVRVCFAHGPSIWAVSLALLNIRSLQSSRSLGLGRIKLCTRAEGLRGS